MSVTVRKQGPSKTPSQALATRSVYILAAMRMLITGAGGMLGHDVQAAADELGHEASGLTRSELDIRDADAVMRAVAELKPEVVINCAAWTDVDGAEDGYDAALAINGTGAGNVGRAAAAGGAWTVHVSTRLRVRWLAHRALPRVRPDVADVRLRAIQARG